MLTEMRASRVSADIVSYNVLLNAWASKRGGLANMRRIFNDLQVRRCPPNVVTYTTLMKANLLDKQFIEVQRIFNDMLAAGIRANLLAYNALLAALASKGNIDVMTKTFKQMISEM